MSNSNFDRHITVFSPQGHLYQMEYALKASNGGNNTAIAVKGPTTSCFITQKKVPDRLVDASFLTSVYKITDTIGCLLIGLQPDIRAQVTRVRYEAAEFRFNHGYAMPAHVLAKRIADLNQVHSQEAGQRTLACMMLLIGGDDEKQAQVFKVDPAGSYMPYKAVAMGKAEAEAMNFLEKKVDDFPSMTAEEDVVECCITAMQHILATDFKSNEIEVGVVTVGQRFRVLDEAEVETRLAAIQAKAEA
jgi:20S proteasome subunit alpha 1